MTDSPRDCLVASAFAEGHGAAGTQHASMQVIVAAPASRSKSMAQSRIRCIVRRGWRLALERRGPREGPSGGPTGECARVRRGYLWPQVGSVAGDHVRERAA